MTAIPLTDLPLDKLKRRFDADVIAELRDRLGSCTSAVLARQFKNNFKAAAIAFLMHDCHNDGHTPLFGQSHDIFSKVRHRENDYDVEEVEGVIADTKSLMFDMVRAKSLLSYFPTYQYLYRRPALIV